MKARVPHRYDHTTKGQRQRETETAMTLFAKALSEYGFSINQIITWASCVSEATKEITGLIGNCKSNKTWQDEILYWGEKMRFDLPKENKLYIRGLKTSYGNEHTVLTLLELYALTKMGYGEVRLKRILTKYAEIADLYGEGVAKYSRTQLEAWCREKGVCLG